MNTGFTNKGQFSNTGTAFEKTPKSFIFEVHRRLRKSVAKHTQRSFWIMKKCARSWDAPTKHRGCMLGLRQYIWFPDQSAKNTGLHFRTDQLFCEQYKACWKTEKWRSGIFFFLISAVSTGVEDSLPLVSGSHLSRVIHHAFMTTARALPINHRALFYLFLCLHGSRGRLQAVKHHWGLDNMNLKLVHVNGECTPLTRHFVLQSR